MCVCVCVGESACVCVCVCVGCWSEMGQGPSWRLLQRLYPPVSREHLLSVKACSHHSGRGRTSPKNFEPSPPNLLPRGDNGPRSRIRLKHADGVRTTESAARCERGGQPQPPLDFSSLSHVAGHINLASRWMAQVSRAEISLIHLADLQQQAVFNRPEFSIDSIGFLYR